MSDHIHAPAHDEHYHAPAAGEPSRDAAGRGVSDVAAIKAAFVAGFAISAEGFNGEHPMNARSAERVALAADDYYRLDYAADDTADLEREAFKREAE